MIKLRWEFGWEGVLLATALLTACSTASTRTFSEKRSGKDALLPSRWVAIASFVGRKQVQIPEDFKAEWPQRDIDPKFLDRAYSRFSSLLSMHFYQVLKPQEVISNWRYREIPVSPNSPNSMDEEYIAAHGLKSIHYDDDPPDLHEMARIFTPVAEDLRLERLLVVQIRFAIQSRKKIWEALVGMRILVIGQKGELISTLRGSEGEKLESELGESMDPDEVKAIDLKGLEDRWALAYERLFAHMITNLVGK